MDRAALRQTLLAILENTTGQSVADLDESADLREGFGLDSVDFVHLVIQVQSELNVELTAADLEAVTTVGQLLDVIQAKPTGGARSAA